MKTSATKFAACTTSAGAQQAAVCGYTPTLISKRKRTSMQIARTSSMAFLASLVCFLLPIRLEAQHNPGRFEAGADYNFVRANAGPDMCGCFNMKEGGDAWLGWYLTDHISVVGQGAYQHASKINGTTATLGLASFMAGPRLTFHRTHRISPFVQGLFGIVHGTGLLTPSPTTGLSSSANALGIQAGGGFDFALKRGFSIRLVQIDYFHTRFDNGVNTSQNNLRVAAGINFHF